MAKAIFTTKVIPTYDDVPEVRYHFPRTYLRVAESAINDWVLYYEPRRESAELSGRSGRQAYFAMARVRKIEPDPKNSDKFYAYVSDYLEFPRAIPFREGSFYYESGLRKPDGSTNKGRFGRAVREVPALEFNLIVSRAFAAEDDLFQSHHRVDDEEPETAARKRLERVTSRLERDRVFQQQIREAYNDTCAMSGLSLAVNRSVEIEAAHIRPVGNGHDGPDSPRNGIALSRTVHWMFDRGLVSLTDDFKVLVAAQRVPEQAKQLLANSGVAVVPPDVTLRPHRQFLDYHRRNIFLG